jgi:hypothetical protein
LITPERVCNKILVPAYLHIQVTQQQQQQHGYSSHNEYFLRCGWIRVQANLPQTSVYSIRVQANLPQASLYSTLWYLFPMN